MRLAIFLIGMITGAVTLAIGELILLAQNLHERFEDSAYRIQHDMLKEHDEYTPMVLNLTNYLSYVKSEREDLKLRSKLPLQLVVITENDEQLDVLDESLILDYIMYLNHKGLDNYEDKG